MKGIQLAIKLNNLATNDPCALCGEPAHANTGPDLFMAHNWAPVCRECGLQYAPVLVGVLDLYAEAARCVHLAGGSLEPEDIPF